jgi:transcription initiation factor TFIIE subunit alpha
MRSILEDKDIYEFLKQFLTEEELQILSKINGKPIKDSELVDYFYKNIEALSKEERRALERKIRRILYKLEELGFVEGTRDEENRVIWRSRKGSGYIGLSLRIKEQIEELKEKRSRYLSSTVFVCPSCGREFSFDEAFEVSFVCPVCGSPLQEMDVEKKLKEIDSEIEKLTKIYKKLTSSEIL